MACSAPSSPRDGAARLRSRRRRAAWKLLAAVWLLDAPPAGAASAAGEASQLAIEVGGSRVLEFEVANRCFKPRKYRLRLEGALTTMATLRSPDARLQPGIAANQPITVTPSRPAPVELLLQPPAAGSYTGSFVVTCLDCPRSCRQPASSDSSWKHDIVVTAINLAGFQARVERFVGEAGLPVEPEVSLRVTSRIEDPRHAAFDLLMSTVFLNDADGPRGLRDGDVPEGEVADLLEQHRGEIVRAAGQIVDLGFVDEGWYYVEVSWQHANGETFTTLAATDGEGRVEFEAVLNAHGVDRVEGAPSAAPGADSGGAEPRAEGVRPALSRPIPSAFRTVARPSRRTSRTVSASQASPEGECRKYVRKNGLGHDCVEVEWWAASSCEPGSPPAEFFLLRHERVSPLCLTWDVKALFGTSCQEDLKWVVRVWYQSGWGGVEEFTNQAPSVECPPEQAEDVFHCPLNVQLLDKKVWERDDKPWWRPPGYVAQATIHSWDRCP